MKFKYSKYLIGAVLAISATSCTDILDLSDPNQFTASNFWQTESNFTGNLTAMMNQFRGYDATVLMNAGELRTDYYWIGNGSGLDGTSFSVPAVVQNQLTADVTQFSTYASFYGFISNCNTYLYYDKLRGDNVFKDVKLRNYLKGMIYGMRAYCNFQIHKMYGTGPIRDDAKVIEGVYSDVELAKSQATVEEFLDNIKKDIELSLTHFKEAGNSTTYSVFNSNAGQIYWGPMASELLAGEVYLWSGKVSTVGVNDKGHIANPADVAIAKTHFLNVLNSGKYSLMPTLIDAINTNNSTNKERIFGTYYNQGEASTNWYNYIMYDTTNPQSKGNYWQCYEDDGITPSPNAARLCYRYNPDNEKVQGSYNTFYLQRLSGQNRYQVRNAYYYQFDENDTRREIFMPNYTPTQDEISNKIMNIANFDKEAHALAGCWVYKYRGVYNASSDNMQGWTWMTYYRLPLVYTYLAEIANYEGNNADVEKYINIIRKRAYGDKWDEAKYGYKASDFKTNEIAVLQEKTKEFFQEGQRWWDLRRMTTVKGGTDKDHMIFQPEGCIGYGLDVASHPLWQEVTTVGSTPSKLETNTPLLDYDTQKHLVLWPIDKTLLSKEEKILQTPGYQGTGEKDRKPW